MGLFGLFRRKKKISDLDELSARRDKVAKSLWSYKSSWGPAFIKGSARELDGYESASSEALDRIDRAYTIVSGISITKKAGAYLSQLEGALKAFDEYYGDASGKSVILEGSKLLCEIAERWMYDQR